MTITAERAPDRPRRRRGATALVDRLSAVLDARTSRRGFLARTAVVGSALAVGPVQYLVRPGTAYAAVCGDDSTCGSGYTVFCATILNGVNRCPPGSLVGGWWKADNSGFCCGSARYYIDCHSFCSCGCSGGSAFCGEGCRNCSCGCGPTSSCDQRRVCCNNFRYGQCRTDVACTGPVWCRVVTCTPPWRVPAWACSSTSATDNNTANHTAPGLPYCTAIDAFYTAVGGPGSFLGEARSGEIALAGGAYTEYDGGSIYWSGPSGAHEVHGRIRDAYRAYGAETGPLGYPTTSERRAPDGQGAYNDFNGSGGSTITWRADLGAHPVQGEIHNTWLALGALSGPLGYPTSAERVSADQVGRYQGFTGPGGDASVHWSPATGAHAVYGLIRRRWLALGGEDGVLGRPLTSELPAAGGGRYNEFVGRGTPTSPQATILWSGATGAHSVRGPIRAAWLAVGGSGGRLGYPVAEPRAAGRGRTRSDFQGGYVVLERRTGRTTITYT
ncbi:MAG TPA: twin-arginine translocation signal domain-containing protein [Mycobacteriales bacterium]|nr:twin-arginine translocation signal domain-containing protein [Mycobacteriales bacterium]